MSRKVKELDVLLRRAEELFRVQDVAETWYSAFPPALGTEEHMLSGDDAQRGYELIGMKAAAMQHLMDAAIVYGAATASSKPKPKATPKPKRAKKGTKR